jgi:phenylpropionate dioxygenase-like ring-hydroxylating dioxygenase large terminal subunit
VSLPAEFPRNQRYVAAHSEKIGPGLLARTIMGEPLVFYRDSAGAVTALAGRCVHRRYPLSKGTLVSDRIVCGYHGFTYDRDGQCTAVPAQHRIPRAARVTRYPLVEQDTLAWVWIGDPGKADPGTIPRVPWLTGSGWAVVRGMAPLAARPGLPLDNLMDLSHETYLHDGYIGTAEVAKTPLSPRSTRTPGRSGQPPHGLARWPDRSHLKPAIIAARDPGEPIFRPAEDDQGHRTRRAASRNHEACRHLAPDTDHR